MAAAAAVAVFAFAASLLVAVPPANGTRVPPRPDTAMPAYTTAEARAVLDKAKRQLRRDTERLRARRVVGSSPSTEITLTLRDLHRAKGSLTGQDRREAEAVLARPSDPGGDSLGGGLADVDYESNPLDHYCGAVACVHWTTGGFERLSASQLATDANTNGEPDYVDTIYNTVASVLAYETDTLGYKDPLPDGGSADPGNPDTKFDVYLAELGDRGLYGYCAPDDDFGGRRVPGYCVLDNDYATSEYGGPSPLYPLRVTAAHELFHAIQFAYDIDEDSWFMEGTATWVEDEVYDTINDNLQFLPFSPIRYPYAPADLTSGGHRYGSWIFFKYASERLGRGIVRRFWDLADAGASSRYSLQAVRTGVQARTSWVPFFATFAAWNTRQPGGYSESRLYPAPRWIKTATLGKRRKSTGWVSINLPHLSSAPVRVIPSAKLSPRKRLRIEADLPPTARGTALLVQRRYRNGAVTNSLMRLNSQGNGRARIGFNHRRLAYVALIPVNTSTSMVLCGMIAGFDGGPAYSCAGRGYHDYGPRYEVRAKVS